MLEHLVQIQVADLRIAKLAQVVEKNAEKIRPIVLVDLTFDFVDVGQFTRGAGSRTRSLPALLGTRESVDHNGLARWAQ